MAKGAQAKINVQNKIANAFGEDKQKSLAAGMNDHVAKPIQLNQLFESVSKNVLKKKNL